MLDLSLGPNAAEWIEGPLPPVEEVGYDTMIVLWTKGYVGFVIPWGDALNPLRWVNNHYMPQWGYGSPAGWWAYVKQGTAPRPDNVKLRGESFVGGTDEGSHQGAGVG